MGGSQQYPQGIQEKYNSFSSRNPITEKGKELEFPEGAGGGKGYRGHEVASTLRREAPLREPGVPPSGSALGKQKIFPILAQLVEHLTVVVCLISKCHRFDSDKSDFIYAHK